MRYFGMFVDNVPVVLWYVCGQCSCGTLVCLWIMFMWYFGMFVDNVHVVFWYVCG